MRPSDPCTAGGCKNSIGFKKLGLCGTHRRRLVLYGSVDGTGRKPKVTKCSVLGCDNPYHTSIVHGMCSMHRRRFLKTGSTEPRSGNTHTHQFTPGDTEKWCCACGMFKGLGGFTTNLGSLSGVYTYCRECTKAKRDKTKDKRYAAHVLKKYNLTQDQYQEILESQGGVCGNPGCGTNQSGGQGRWHIDHDHACCSGTWSCGRCVRGLLCNSCNVGLGMFGDNTTRLEGAVQYLRDWESATA